MKTLVIARHGNTFRPGETPTRVGARTDLPLVEEERARGIGLYLKKLGIIPSRILAAPLQRTRRTAELAAEALGNPCPIQIENRLVEIDYGPDENQTEQAVALRLGRVTAQAAGQDPSELTENELESLGISAIDLWNTQAILPDGWIADPAALIETWRSLAASIAEDETLLCVSSNGTIRFAPHITGDYANFCATHDIKVPTGGVCIFTAQPGKPWQCSKWGIKAFKAIS